MEYNNILRLIKIGTLYSEYESLSSQQQMLLQYIAGCNLSPAYSFDFMHIKDNSVKIFMIDVKMSILFCNINYISKILKIPQYKLSLIMKFIFNEYYKIGIQHFRFI